MIMWRATLRRGRLPSDSGRDRSASLQFAAQTPVYLVAAIGRFTSCNYRFGLAQPSAAQSFLLRSRLVG